MVDQWYFMHAGLVQSSYFSMDTAKMPAGMGSGFIWDDKGHVVTNYHVIKDANEVQVTLVDQSVWPAKARRPPSVSQLGTCIHLCAGRWSGSTKWPVNHAMQMHMHSLHALNSNHTVRSNADGRPTCCQLCASILIRLPSCAGVSICARGGQVVGGDADKDVAVLQLDMPREKMDELKAISLGTSTNLLVGQKVPGHNEPLCVLLI